MSTVPTATSGDSIEATIDKMLIAGPFHKKVPAYALANTLYIDDDVRAALGVKKGDSIVIDGVTFEVKTSRKTRGENDEQIVFQPAIADVRHEASVNAFFDSKGIAARVYTGAFLIDGATPHLPELDALHVSESARAQLGLSLGDKVEVEGATLTVKDGRKGTKGADTYTPVLCHPDRADAVRQFLRDKLAGTPAE